MSLRIILIFCLCNLVGSVCREDFSCERCIKNDCHYIKVKLGLTCVERLNPGLGVRRIYKLNECDLNGNEVEKVNGPSVGQKKATFHKIDRTEGTTPKPISTTIKYTQTKPTIFPTAVGNTNITTPGNIYGNQSPFQTTTLKEINYGLHTKEKAQELGHFLNNLTIAVTETSTAEKHPSAQIVESVLESTTMNLGQGTILYSLGHGQPVATTNTETDETHALSSSKQNELSHAEIQRLNSLVPSATIIIINDESTSAFDPTPTNALDSETQRVVLAESTQTEVAAVSREKQNSEFATTASIEVKDESESDAPASDLTDAGSQAVELASISPSNTTTILHPVLTLTTGHKNDTLLPAVYNEHVYEATKQFSIGQSTIHPILFTTRKSRRYYKSTSTSTTTTPIDEDNRFDHYEKIKPYTIHSFSTARTTESSSFSPTPTNVHNVDDGESPPLMIKTTSMSNAAELAHIPIPECKNEENTKHDKIYRNTWDTEIARNKGAIIPDNAKSSAATNQRQISAQAGLVNYNMYFTSFHCWNMLIFMVLAFEFY